MNDLLFKTKQLRILLLLRDKSRDWHISDLAKLSSATYVHTCNFIKSCESAGIMKSEKHGKIKFITLTEKGAQIAESVNTAYSIINKEAQPVQQPQQSEQKPKP